MIRLVFFLLFVSAVLAAAVHVSVWVFLAPLGLLAVFAYTVGGSKLRCPSCRKRVKIGATACHHCGRATVPDAAPR